MARMYSKADAGRNFENAFEELYRQSPMPFVSARHIISPVPILIRSPLPVVVPAARSGPGGVKAIFDQMKSKADPNSSVISTATSTSSGEQQDGDPGNYGNKDKEDVAPEISAETAAVDGASSSAAQASVSDESRIDRETLQLVSKLVESLNSKPDQESEDKDGKDSLDGGNRPPAEQTQERVSAVRTVQKQTVDVGGQNSGSKESRQDVRTQSAVSESGTNAKVVGDNASKAKTVGENNNKVRTAANSARTVGSRTATTCNDSTIALATVACSVVLTKKNVESTERSSRNANSPSKAEKTQQKRKDRSEETSPSPRRSHRLIRGNSESENVSDTSMVEQQSKQTTEKTVVSRKSSKTRDGSAHASQDVGSNQENAKHKKRGRGRPPKAKDTKEETTKHSTATHSTEEEHPVPSKTDNKRTVGKDKNNVDAANADLHNENVNIAKREEEQPPKNNDVAHTAKKRGPGRTPKGKDTKEETAKYNTETHSTEEEHPVPSKTDNKRTVGKDKNNVDAGNADLHNENVNSAKRDKEHPPKNINVAHIATKRGPGRPPKHKRPPENYSGASDTTNTEAESADKARKDLRTRNLKLNPKVSQVLEESTDLANSSADTLIAVGSARTQAMLSLNVKRKHGASLVIASDSEVTDTEPLTRFKTLSPKKTLSAKKFPPTKSRVPVIVSDEEDSVEDDVISARNTAKHSSRTKDVFSSDVANESPSDTPVEADAIPSAARSSNKNDTVITSKKVDAVSRTIRTFCRPRDGKFVPAKDGNMKNTSPAPSAKGKESASAVEKSKGRRSMPCEEDKNKTYKLSSWSLQPVVRHRGVRIEGKLPNTDYFWLSSIIVERVSNRILKSISGSQYRLVGPHFAANTRAAGFSQSVAALFKWGFPQDWKELLEPVMGTTGEKSSVPVLTTHTNHNLSKPAKDDKNKTDKPEELEDTFTLVQRKRKAQDEDLHTPVNQDKDGVKKKTGKAAGKEKVGKAGAEDLQTPVQRRTQVSADKFHTPAQQVRKDNAASDSSAIWTPQGLLSRNLDASMVRRTKSGRCVVPRLAKWAGQYLQLDDHGNVTIGFASQAAEQHFAKMAEDEKHVTNTKFLSKSAIYNSLITSPRPSVVSPGITTSTNSKLDTNSTADKLSPKLGTARLEPDPARPENERLEHSGPEKNSKSLAKDKRNTSPSKKSKIRGKDAASSKVTKGRKDGSNSKTKKSPSSSARSTRSADPKNLKEPQNKSCDSFDNEEKTKAKKSRLEKVENTKKPDTVERNKKSRKLGNLVPEKKDIETDDSNMVELSANVELSADTSSFSVDNMEAEVMGLVKSSKEKRLQQRAARKNNTTCYTRAVKNGNTLHQGVQDKSFDYSDDDGAWADFRQKLQAKRQEKKDTSQDASVLPDRSKPQTGSRKYVKKSKPDSSKAAGKGRQARSKTNQGEVTDANLAGRGVQSSSGKHKEGESSMDSSAAEHRPWTSEEVRKLEKAKELIPSDEPNYWEAMSHYVGSRSAQECSAFYLLDIPDSRHKTKAKEQKSILVEETPTLRGKKGTLKRRREIRAIMEHTVMNNNEDDGEDVFQDAPLRANKKKKTMCVDFNKSDTDVFGRNPNFFTPKHDGSDVETRTFYKTPVTCRKTPNVPSVVSPSVHQDTSKDVDQVIFRMKKTKRPLQKIAERKPKHSKDLTHRQVKGLLGKSSAAPDGLFQIDEERSLHEDEDEEEDYYYSDDAQ